MLGIGAGGGLPSDPLVFGLDPATQPRRFFKSAVAKRLVSQGKIESKNRGMVNYPLIN